MMYLVSQMLLCIVLALATGAGIGWLLQRKRSSASAQALRMTVAQQRIQVDQARSDVSLVTQDFDELQSRTRDELDQLRQENRRIPSLLQNLEKSQTLVRQLMKKHEAQLRDLAHEKEGLENRVASLNERELLWQTTSDELDTLRRQLVGTLSDQPTAGSLVGVLTSRDTTAVPIEQPLPVAATIPTLEVASPPDADEPCGAVATRSSWASAPLSDVDPSVSALADDKQSESHALMRSMGLEFDEQGSDTTDAPSSDHANEEQLLRSVQSMPGDDVNVVEEVGTFDGADDAYRSLDDTALDDDDLDLDGSTDPDEVEQLFEPVDRHDDLKRIFGIGPVTETALNKLGITSYSQLAELERHEIETIASALQIFPSRIESDDWVGNARRQLEDVLEEL